MYGYLTLQVFFFKEIYINEEKGVLKQLFQSCIIIIFSFLVSFFVRVFWSSERKKCIRILFFTPSKKNHVNSRANIDLFLFLFIIMKMLFLYFSHRWCCCYMVCCCKVIVQRHGVGKIKCIKFIHMNIIFFFLVLVLYCSPCWLATVDRLPVPLLLLPFAPKDVGMRLISLVVKALIVPPV